MTTSGEAIGVALVPALIDFVSPAEGIARLRAAEVEVAELDREARRLRAEADELEALLDGDTFDPECYQWFSVRLSRFVEQLRTEADREFRPVLRPLAAPPRPGDPEPHVLSWGHLFEPPAAPAPVSELVPVIDTADEPPRALDVSEVEPFDRDLEVEFWDDEPAESTPSLPRLFRSLVFQALAVVLILAAILIRIG